MRSSVVPGQLAKLATVAGAQDLIAGMGMGEDDDEDDYEDEEDDAYDADAWEEYGTYSAAFASGAGGVRAVGVRPRDGDGSARLVGRHPGHRRRAVATEYSRDAPEGVGRSGVRSVRAADSRGGCEILPAVRRSAGTDGIEAGPLYVKRNETMEAAAKRKKKALGSRRLPFRPAAPPQGTMGRLGIDISGATMSNSEDAERAKVQAKAKVSGRTRETTRRGPSGGDGRREL